MKWDKIPWHKMVVFLAAWGGGGGDSRMSPRDDPTLSGQGSVCEPVACSLKRLTKVSLRQQNRGGVTSQH